MSALLCDDSNLSEKLVKRYKRVFVLGKTIESTRVSEVALYKYFIKSHAAARSVNKVLLEKAELDSALHCSLLKMVDHSIFEAVRIIEVIKDLADEEGQLDVITNTNGLVTCLTNEFDFQLGANVQVYKVPVQNKKHTILVNVLKLIVLFLNSFRVRTNRQIEKVFFLFNSPISFDFARPYLDEKTLTYPFFGTGLSCKQISYGEQSFLSHKFIIFKEILRGWKRTRENRRKVQTSQLPSAFKKLYLGQLMNLEIHAMAISSLKNKFTSLKYAVGLFDAYDQIDYITSVLNHFCGVKTVCFPHGINFRQKVNYISLGTNYYTFWSEDHKQRLVNSSLVPVDDVNYALTGNVVYTNTRKYLTESKGGKNIVVVGEYFANDNFYSSPFNVAVSKMMFDVLQDFAKAHKDVQITIRTRVGDDYASLALGYVSPNIKISDPGVSIIDEINENDLIISVFSNALHEALLLEKNVLQVNLLEIENYRDLAKDGLVHYADTVDQFKKALMDWYEGRLPQLDFSQHLVKYANNGIFEKYVYN